MSHRFRLMGLDWKTYPEFEIQDEQYQNLSKQSALYDLCIDVEIAFDHFVETYFELETEMLSRATREMAFGGYVFEENVQKIATLDRKLSSFLAASRSYLEHVKQKVSTLFERLGRSLPKPTIQGMIEDRRETCAEFKFVEAVRNEVQHANYLVRGYTPFASRPNVDVFSLRYGFSLNIDLSRLYHSINEKNLRARKNKFDRKRLDEALELLGSNFDFRNVLRRYVESVAEIHEVVRKQIEPCGSELEESLLRMVDEVYVLVDEATTWEALLEVRQDVTMLNKRVSIDRSNMKWRHYLRTKNAGFATISHRYVTSEVHSD